jgi:2-C-methyl-D-erythritol 4-phosphate cytidylyltransferase
VTIVAIVLAGGKGTRMHAMTSATKVNKVFFEVGGRSIVDRSLALFEKSLLVDQIVLVANPSDMPACEALGRRFPKVVNVVPGGKTRHRSEYAGLAVLAPRIDGAVGAIPGIPLPGTTVLVADGWVSGYPRDLWAVQTPQAFKATWLLEAHNKAARQGFVGTDTASVVEWAGGDVAVIEGEPDNIKITTPGDLSRARQIARRRCR